MAAVGPATAKSARELGYDVEFTAEEATGKGLAAGLGEKVAGRRVLLPRSDRARPELPEMLRAAGARVTDVVSYSTVPPRQQGLDALKEVQAGAVHAVALASPSAFERLAEQLGMEALRELTQHVALAAIGPVTAAAIRQAGLPVAIVPSKPSAESFVDALAAHFASATGGGGK